MISNYKSFRTRLLLESLLAADPEFFSYIKDISSPKVGEPLCNIIDKGIDIKTNYNSLSVGDKNSEVGFLPDTQYQRFIAKGDDISTKTKSSIGIGRMVRQILTDNGYKVTDSDIESFVNAYKAQWDKRKSPNNIEVVKGNDILYWYNEDNYESDGGDLGNSCMRFTSSNEFMKIYAENPQVISLVILKSENNKLLGRALIWETDGGDNYLDRIYTRFDSDEELIYEWVRRNVDPHILSYYRSDDPLMECTLKKVYFPSYPYADTFSYLYVNMKDQTKGYVSNQYSEKDVDKDFEYFVYTMESTGGTRDLVSHQYSEYSNKWIPNGRVAHVSSIGVVDVEDTRLCKRFSSHYLKGDVVYSDTLNDWIPKDQLLDHPKYGLIFIDSVIESITGYIGDKKSPIDIYAEFLSAIKNDELAKYFSMVETLQDNDKIKNYNRIPFNIDIICTDNNAYGYGVPVMFCEKVLRLDDSMPDNIRSVASPIDWWLPEKASKFFNLKASRSALMPVEIIAKYVNKYFYMLYQKLDKDKFNKDYQEEYEEYLLQLHTLMLNTMPEYKTYISLSKKGESAEYILANMAKDISLQVLDEYGEDYRSELESRCNEWTVDAIDKLFSIFILGLLVENGDIHSARYRVANYMENNYYSTYRKLSSFDAFFYMGDNFEGDIWESYEDNLIKVYNIYMDDKLTYAYDINKALKVIYGMCSGNYTNIVDSHMKIDF